MAVNRVVFISYFVLLFSVTLCAQEKAATEAVKFTSGYVNVNGIKIFYKEAGTGNPVLFLHGGLGTSEEHFSHQLEEFGKSFRVITMHTRGHGKSEFDNVAFSYELFSDDVYAFIQQMKIDSLDIVGFSDGGIVGAILAARHPGLVKKLVLIGANANTEAIKPEAIAWVNGWDMVKMTTLIKQSFNEHPMPGKLSDFVLRMQKLFLTAPNLTDNDLKKIGCPTLIIAGDNDLIKSEHQQYLRAMISNSSLCILPNTGHDAQIEQFEVVNRFIFEFLKK